MLRLKQIFCHASTMGCIIYPWETKWSSRFVLSLHVREFCDSENNQERLMSNLLPCVCEVMNSPCHHKAQRVLSLNKTAQSFWTKYSLWHKITDRDVYYGCTKAYPLITSFFWLKLIQTQTEITYITCFSFSSCQKITIHYANWTFNFLVVSRLSSCSLNWTGPAPVTTAELLNTA